MEKTKIPFFERFRILNRYIETSLGGLEQELQKPPGSYPKKYDHGMKRIQNDIDTLKDESNRLYQEMKSVESTCRLIDSTEGLVNEIAAGVEEIKERLMKYGYKPYEVEPNIEEPPDEDVKIDNSDNIDSEKNAKLKSPVLSELGQLVVKKKPLPTLNTAKKMHTVYEEDCMQDEQLITDSVKKRVSDWLADVPEAAPGYSPVPSEHMRSSSKSLVDVFIENEHGKISSESICDQNTTQTKFSGKTPESPKLSYQYTKFSNETPTTGKYSMADATSQIRSNFGRLHNQYEQQPQTYMDSFEHNVENTESFNSFLQDENSDQDIDRNKYNYTSGIDNDKKYRTPDEHRFLSSHSKNCFENTPEEPSLNFQYQSFGNKTDSPIETEYNIEKLEQKYTQSKRTPEEPILKYQRKPIDNETPEEPKLKYERLQKDKETPDEPKLNFQLIQQRINKENETPEEPKLNFQLIQQRSNKENETPEEPKLNVHLFQKKINKKEITPEEPKINYHLLQHSRRDYDSTEEPKLDSKWLHQRTDKNDIENTPEEPKMDFNVKKFRQNYQEPESNSLNLLNTPKTNHYISKMPETPCTPELSEYTTNVLSFMRINKPLKESNSNKDG